jgi:hypothetical protein
VLHLPFRREEYGAIHGVMVYFIAVKHAIWKLDSVWASAATTAAILRTASLDVLSKSLIEASQISFLREGLKILLPLLWWPKAIGVNAMHLLGVVVLTVVVMRGLGGFISS